jgi:citrate lyase beta subunit
MSREPLHAAALGATLYMPATRPDLGAAIIDGRIPGLRSVVICLEDAVAARELPLALTRLAAFLQRPPASPDRPAIFVRPRDPGLAATIARLPGAHELDGYVLPKATAETLPAWLASLPGEARLMPTVESPEAFEDWEMHRLRTLCVRLGERVLAIRIGGADLLQLLGARRSRTRTAYDGPLGPVIARLAGLFAPAGFSLSAPVFEAFDAPALLREEVERDLEHGLVTKTAIHPAQVSVIQSAYRVSADDHEEALQILAAGPAVFGRAGRMCETATHTRWAERTTERAARFGVEPPRRRRSA